MGRIRGYVALLGIALITLQLEGASGILLWNIAAMQGGRLYLSIYKT